MKHDRTRKKGGLDRAGVDGRMSGTSHKSHLGAVVELATIGLRPGQWHGK